MHGNYVTSHNLDNIIIPNDSLFYDIHGYDPYNINVNDDEKA